MVAPSSRSQYYAKHSEPSGARAESPPISLWHQRQQQRAQERDHRAQSAPKRPPASPQTDTVLHEHRDRGKSVKKVRQEPLEVARLEPPASPQTDTVLHEHRDRSTSVKKMRQESLNVASKNDEERDQSAHRERASSSLRGRRERQERAHSALRERHERARSARRERHDRARSITEERQDRPQSAPKDRNSESQPANQFEKRLQSLISELEAKSRKRPVSVDREIEGKKLKASQPSVENTAAMPLESKAAEERTRNVPNESDVTDEFVPTTVEQAPTEDGDNPRRRSKESPFRKHGRQFVRRSRSRERSMQSKSVDPVMDIAEEGSSTFRSHKPSKVNDDISSSSQASPCEKVVQSITVETLEPCEKLHQAVTKETVESCERIDQGIAKPRERVPQGLVVETVEPRERVPQGLTVESAEPRENVRQGITVEGVEPREIVRRGITVETLELDDEADSSASQQSELLLSKKRGTRVIRSRSRESVRPSASSSSSHQQRGAMKEEKQGDHMARSRSVERRSTDFVAEPTRVAVAFQSAPRLRKAHEFSNTNHGRHSASLSASPSTRFSDADKQSLNVKTTARHIPPSNAGCHESPLREHGRSLSSKPRRTHAQFDELGNIEVVAVGSNETEDDSGSPRKQHDDTDMVRANSISEDRKGNVEVVITGAKSKTIELITAWSHRTTRNTPGFNGMRQLNTGYWEKERETPTMSNVSLSRGSAGHIKFSNIKRDQHTFVTARQSKFRCQNDLDERNEPDSNSVDRNNVLADDSSDSRGSLRSVLSNSGAKGRSDRNQRNVNDGSGVSAAPIVLAGEQHGETAENTLPIQNHANSRIRSNSIDRLRQRIDGRNTPSRNRLSIDPCASSDVALNWRGMQAGIEKRNASASEAYPPSTPSFIKVRSDPPSNGDCQHRSESSMSTSVDSTSMLSKRSKSVGIHQDGYPASTHDSPLTSRADPPSHIACDPSKRSPELKPNCRSFQDNDRQPEGEVSRPAAVAPVRTSHDNKRVENGDPSATHESASSPDSHSQLSRNSDRIGRLDELDKNPSNTIRRNIDHTTEQKSLLRNRQSFPCKGSHIVPDHASVSDSPRLRRSVIAASRNQCRRSLGDEAMMIDRPAAVQDDVAGGLKVSKLEILRRLSSRKSFDRAPLISKTTTTASNEGPDSQPSEKSIDSVPDIVETVSTSSEEAVEVPRSQGVKRPDVGSKKNASRELDAEDAFPLEILYPSEKHKTYGGLANGYTVWCSYGSERPTRYGSWIPPAKLFDTTYKSQTEANDRAKYLFFWENPLKVEPVELEQRCDALAETVKKNCKSFDCKVNGGTETWRVGVVPSAVFEWLDRAETRRHDFDEAIGSGCDISTAFTVD